MSRNNKIGEDYEQNDNNNDEQLVLLSSLQQLEELDLSECQLPGLFVAQFLDGKRPPANLKKLFLQGNPFGDGGFEALMTLVGNAPLQELNTSKCQLTDEAMRKISFEEGGSLFMPSLRSWNLCDNQLTEIAISHLGEGLKHATVLPQLKELNLSGNELGENGVKLLAAALETRNSNETLLEILDLTNTKCTVEGASAIIQRSKVKTLHLFNNNLSSDGFRTLSGVLKGGHPTMEYLDLGGNGADQASVVVLLNALVENSVVDFKNDLKTLVVGGNESGDAVEQIVCKVKVVHPRLEIARDKKKSNDHR